MDATRRCAYCGQAGGLTNEHVFPECFRKTFEAISLTKTGAGEKAIFSALEIGDVCARCNSGPLSQLDAYLCVLNARYFSKIIRSGDHARFEYDVDLLLRMLLKIGFNVARVRKWPLWHWQDATAYILGKTRRPTEFRIFLQLIIPRAAKKTNLPVTPGTYEVPPLPMSVYPIDTRDRPGLRSGSWVSIWSYRFFLLREDTQVQRSVRQQAIARWLKDTKGACELTRRRIATIYASSVDVLDVLEGSPIFHEQLSKARNLKWATEFKKSRETGPRSS